MSDEIKMSVTFHVKDKVMTITSIPVLKNRLLSQFIRDCQLYCSKELQTDKIMSFEVQNSRLDRIAVVDGKKCLLYVLNLLLRL